MTEEERKGIFQRNTRDRLSNDTELYSSGMLGSCSLSNEVFVACSVLAEWKKQRRESEKEPIKKHDNFPKSKRTTARVPNPVVINQKNQSCTEKTPEKREILPSSTELDFSPTFKQGENNLFSIQKSNNDVSIISEKPLPEKCSQEKYEDTCARAIKKIRTEQLQHLVEPIYMLENNTNISANLKARLLNNKAVLVIRKNLTKTDVAENNQRLSIPESHLKNQNFLTEEERTGLTYKEGEAVPHLYAKLIEPCGEECEIKLARWKMRSSFVFNMFGSWKKVVARNNLRENTPIEVYSFREDSHLYFAVVRV